MIATEDQLRVARALAGLSQSELARRAKVGIATIKRMESFAGLIGIRLETIQKVENVLASAGVVLTEEGPNYLRDGAGQELAQAVGRRSGTTAYTSGIERLN